MPVVTSAKRKPSAKLPVVWIVAAVAVAAAVLVAVRSRGVKGEGAVEAPAGDAPEVRAASAASAAAAAPETGAGATIGTSRTGKTGGTIGAADVAAVPKASPAADSAKEAWRVADSNRLAKSEAILAAAAPKKHFDNDVENVIEEVSRPGAQFLMVPQVDLPEDEVLGYLRKPVDIFEDDDAETVAAKERTAEFKARALKFVEGGGTINQFVRDCAAAEAEGRATVEEIRREKTRILLSQGMEAAQAYLDEMNPQLKAAGLPEVKIGRADLKQLKDKAAAEK